MNITPQDLYMIENRYTPQTYDPTPQELLDFLNGHGGQQYFFSTEDVRGSSTLTSERRFHNKMLEKW